MIKRPIMRYHGGKWRMAKHIINLLPPHSRYIEPFGGAASVLLRKKQVGYEVHNDLDGRIYNFFSVIRENAQGLIELMKKTPFSRQEFDNAQFQSADSLEDARRLLVLSCMGFSSDSSTRVGRSGFRTHADGVATYLKGFDHLYAVRDRLRNVILENRPAVGVIKQYDSEGALLYVDPPYVLSERNNKSGGYRHELSDDDHKVLSKTLKSVKGHVVLSGYNSDLYNDLYSDWGKIVVNSMAQSNRGSVRKKEVIWLSPSVSDVRGLI